MFFFCCFILALLFILFCHFNTCICYKWVKMAPRMAAVLRAPGKLCSFSYVLFVFLLFYVLDVVSITVYDRDTLLNIGSSVAQRKPDFEFLNACGLFTDTASEPFIWVAQLRKHRRRRKRAGVLVRLRRRAFRHPLPTVLLANVQSLDNKLCELRARISYQRETRDCCVICLTETWITDNDETAYREEVSILPKWCQENHLSLNIDKTKELVVDYRRQSREHTPITIDKTPVERVSSFKFLGVHITEDLTWSAHTDAVLKKAHQRLFFLRRLSKFGTSPIILRSFYTCTVESILTGCITAWFGNSTAGNRRALQRVVRTAHHIVGGELPSLQDIYTRRCTRKARRIIKDSSHPSHSLLSLLPSGRHFRSIRSRTSRLRDSFFPQAIRLMNSQK